MVRFSNACVQRLATRTLLCIAVRSGSSMVAAFSVAPSRGLSTATNHFPASSVAVQQRSVALREGGQDDIDAWYADFDVSDFNVEDFDKNANRDYDDDRNGGGGGRGYRDNNSNNNNYNRGGGGGGYRNSGGNRNAGGRNGGGRSRDRPDYSRDFDADQSNVDESTVTTLIEQRDKARSTGRFEEADSIRDTLLETHGVMVRDKDRKWRSGCSDSGSGRGWLSFRDDNGRGNSRFDNNPRGGGRGRGREIDFGPTGHDYVVSPDAGPNESSLSEDQINQLIAERLQFKLRRNFRPADDIQEQLVASGVFVHDGRKEWRADGIGFGNAIDARADGKPAREAGPFRMATTSQPTESEEIIQALIEERNEARKNRNYDLADDIRDELREEYNVEVRDRLRQWSVGGEFEPENGRANDGPTHSGFRFRGGQPLSPEELREVTQMLELRADLKVQRKFAKCDQIRDRLRNQYKIGIDDRNREFYSVNGEYSESDVSVELDELTRAYVQQQMDKRSLAKLEGEFDAADAIRDELRDDYLIEINDRTKQWTALPSEEDEVDGDDDGDDDGEYEVVDATEFEETEAAAAAKDDDADATAFESDEGVEEVGDDVGAEDVLNDWEEAEEEDEEEVEVEAEEPAAGDLDEEDLEVKTVAQLKELLKERGLKVSGKKAELIERLQTA